MSSSSPKKIADCGDAVTFCDYKNCTPMYRFC